MNQDTKRLESRLKTIMMHANKFHDGAVKVSDTLETSVLIVASSTDGEPSSDLVIAVFEALMREYSKVDL